MTNKQKKFADEYIIDCNATRAYLAAYPAVKKTETAMANASRLLRNAKVKAYIDEQLQQISNAKIADAKERREFYSCIVRDAAQKTTDRLKAGEMLDKLEGLHTQKINVEGIVPVVISGGDELED
ncbi:MAG: terminase small subunit [Oscillospiraceae bacterium]|jgi:phage terminase small subunit|nr:terminase small subunit [Oscillospiraceae bacterium]